MSTLLKSDSPEVVAVANSAVNDKGSVTGANLFKIQQETGLNPRSTSPQEVMSVLNVNSQTSVGSFLVKLGLFVICMVDIERGNAHLLPCAPPSSLHSFPISGYIQPQLVIFLNSQTSGASFLVIL